jgi:hypothetical protein
MPEVRMKHCQYPGCNAELNNRQFKWCSQCRRKRSSDLEKGQAKKLNKGVLHEPKGHRAYENMILNHNREDVRNGKAKQSYVERPCGMTEGTFTVAQGHKKPNAQ